MPVRLKLAPMASFFLEQETALTAKYWVALGIDLSMSCTSRMVSFTFKLKTFV